MGITFTSFPIRGVDVSQFNGNIDWSKVNCNFAVIRAGYGRTLDKLFKVNWANSKGRVKRMSYWYLDYYSNYKSGSPINGTSDKTWGEIQAEYAWGAIKDDPEGMIFLDIENASPSIAPTIFSVSSRVQAIAKAFLEKVDQLSGKTNGIYCSMSLLNWFNSWFKNRPVWIAWYNESQTIQSVTNAALKAGWTGKPLMWQYTSDGDINNDGVGDGIAMGMGHNALDLNAWMGSAEEYAALFGSVNPSTEPVPLYKIKILIYNLMVRTGPGILYPHLRRANFPGEYHIYEEKNGYGRISASSSEWVSLSRSYVQRLDETGTPTQPPAASGLYRLKILIYNLMVRTGPDKSYTALRRANFPGEYTIYEEKNNYGRISQSVSEWINLSPEYVQKLDNKSFQEEVYPDLEPDLDVDPESLQTSPLSEQEMLSRLWAAHPELHS